MGNLARTLVVPDRFHLPFVLGLGAAVVGLGVRAGCRADDLGLGRRHLGRGLRYGLGAAAAVGGALALAAASPAAGWFDDPRAEVDVPSLVWSALVVIPVGTVLVEELAFRGVLQALLRRGRGRAQALAVGSALFGLWHVAPTWSDGPGTVLGTFVATTAAGVAFGWLRERSGSLAAPALAHVATNSGALVTAWLLAR